MDDRSRALRVDCPVADHRDRRQLHAALEVLAVAAHGAAIAIHLLGIVYNGISAGRFDRDCWIHGLALGYSARSLKKHAARLRSA